MTTRTLRTAIAVIVCALGITADVARVRADFDQTPNHPPCEGALYKSLPASGLSYTVPTGFEAFENVTLYLKISTQHVPVPAVSSGDVITPESVSGWPTNKNGKYMELSHADICEPKRPPVAVTTTTTTTTTTSVAVTTPPTPPTQAPTTTEPTVPPTAAPTTVPPGTAPQSSLGIPITAPEPPASEPEIEQPVDTKPVHAEPVGELPHTGSDGRRAPLAALALLLCGIPLVLVARRRRI